MTIQAHTGYTVSEEHTRSGRRTDKTLAAVDVRLRILTIRYSKDSPDTRYCTLQLNTGTVARRTPENTSARIRLKWINEGNVANGTSDVSLK